MRILVTGGAGFIGSALVLHLVQDLGHEVVTVDALTYAANPRSLAPLAGNPHHRLVEADICDAARMRALVSETKPQAIVHLAAESHVDRSISGSGAFVRTNVLGTHVLLEAARTLFDRLDASERERFRFLHVSTDEVYGSLGDSGLFTEATPYDPRSPYSASKAASDHLVSAWGHTYGLPVLVSNCSNNYGPRQFPEKLVPLMILNALEGKPLPLYGDGLNVRDWLHVEDHARALVAILEGGRPGESYNVGARAERTNRVVVEAICAAMDELRPDGAPHARLVTAVPDRPGHDRRYAIDPAKIERELGWRPRMDFERGLRTTVRWYLDNEDWWQPLRQRVYGGERLGLVAR
ncbi:dTDP-glucose 4,6-dehydratase [Chelatococcus sp. SYSU_G07232]|uniref:dTDP-glucose 4,6-dehydratase n=1 Tax=Chelatococcus albus TaxID=3047466 RepID=A0ABT7AHF4_9HYPH|nr:dTDP-glucose 4,6-dehydratase [Chelatococcus sp. SYSU_G07232]MDJ1158804.1 dTDP-glucose 4,6-dehydratase [Chelatococcus sp. SYSU_G07232]